MAPESQRLLRVEQSGERLNISRAKVYELIASGELRSIKIGGARRIPVEAIDELVASLSENSRGTAA